MATYRELVYMCLDELKLTSDDSLYNENHIQFLLSKYRTFILKQRYSDIKKQIPESNYQTICLDLEKVENIPNAPCVGESLRSIQTIPNLMKIGIQRVYPLNYYLGEIIYVTRERMRYVGHNKYLKNIIYTSLGPDGRLYFKSANPQYLYLSKVKMTGIFEDIEGASNLQCQDDNTPCDIMDKNFPIEDSLIPVIIELVVKELGGVKEDQEDQENNANDDFAKNANK